MTALKKEKPKMNLTMRSAAVCSVIGMIVLAGLCVRGRFASHRSVVTPVFAAAEDVMPPSQGTRITQAQEITLLRRKVKYVFVLYQENRSFDSYFGTYPGADGLFSQPPVKTPGFVQTLINTDGTQGTISPFRIGPAQYASDTDDIDHSHPAIVRKMDIVDHKARMDQFALTEERRFSPQGNPSLKAKQFGELAMAYEDGDTIPLLWRYAHRFVLCDHIFQLMTGPSTPGNLSILGAQTGATQWMRHLDQAYQKDGAVGPGVPMLDDTNPYWGSPQDKTKSGKMPDNPSDAAHDSTHSDHVQRNLTYATLPLVLRGKTLQKITKTDRDPDGDLDDVGDDVKFITRSGKATIPWGWYQEGFDPEPTDIKSSDPLDAEGSHASYVTHHNGPSYFGYIANNPAMNKSLHGLHEFSIALQKRMLPIQGGLFYVKGGFHNQLGLKPVDPRGQDHFLGDDDHPGYSDSQISESQIAETVNKIAQSPYWKQCAIIITWDDSEGDYDHVPPPIHTYGPDGSVISDGPRVPLILISPYAKNGAIVHDPGDHASVVKLVDLLFGLTPLADLPDEREGRRIGERRGLKNEGPADDLTPGITNLLPAFDPARLSGKSPPLSASYVEIPESLIHILPQQSGYGWHQIGVMPTDYKLGIKNPLPPDFNPRPSSEPTP